MKPDRLGYPRCDGYNQEDFVLCELCMPDGIADRAKPKPSCRKCGGYGEYPMKQNFDVNIWLCSVLIILDIVAVILLVIVFLGLAIYR